MLDVKKLSKLPLRESRKDYLTRKYGDMWNIPKFDRPWHDGEPSESPWKRAKWILRKNIGKSFDDAFSYYCTFVKQHEQDYFTREFQPRIWSTPDYIVDNQKRIQLNPDRYKKKKKPIVFQSFDYEEGYYSVKRKRIISKDEYWRMDLGLYVSQDIIRVIIKGFERTFKSKKDTEYKRLVAEKIKAQRRNEKLIKEVKKQKADYLLATLKKENENNNV